MRANREEFSTEVRRAAWQRANGACEGRVMSIELSEYGFPKMVRCNAPIDLGEFHYDHIIPYWTCRDSSLSNCQVLCRACHHRKTKGDVKDIAKVKRLQDKRGKVRKPKGRPMPGTKRSGLRKRMSGQVERR